MVVIVLFFPAGLDMLVLIMLFVVLYVIIIHACGDADVSDTIDGEGATWCWCCCH